MFDEQRATRVGAIAALVILVAATLIVSVEPADLRPGADASIYFEHVGALQPGADVQIAGRVIGEVARLELVGAEGLEPDHLLYPTGGVVARVHLQRRYLPWVRVNSELFLATKGLFGDSYLEVGPAPASEPQGRPVREGDRLRGVDPARFETILVLSFENFEAAQELFAAIAPDARALRDALLRLDATLAAAEPEPGAYDELRAAQGRLSTSLDRLGELSGDVSLADLVDLADRTSALVDRAEARLDSLGADLGELGAELDRLRDRVPADLRQKIRVAAERVQGSAARLRSIVHETRELIAFVERGQGSVGGIMNDPEFVDDAKELGKIIKRQPWLLLGRPAPPPRRSR